ncbi:DUF2326 domain-containing protein [Candidatus Enterococcus huntleyi]|uniref:DUF2326 domain-containing protein n=1 Tax=Candidatus Enterococcus huntleyi TaxID=1857217 RepID=UPI001F24ACC9|nr:DUF2326 domain-containing protein [Enterococcus sp. JM4C]
MNLIVDDTPLGETKTTGNNVGKTTVLKLIDFCLGAKSKLIYTDDENQKQTYSLVKDFLFTEDVRVKLILSENLADPAAKEVSIERNFLTASKAIRKINGEDVLAKEFEEALERQLFPDKTVDKPTFRQIISHNIRYKDTSINNTTKTLDKFTANTEYEALYLYLLGCRVVDGERKQVLTAKIKQEEMFKKRLEKVQTKSAYEVALTLIDAEIGRLNKKKERFNLNEDYEQDLEELNRVKYNLNKKSSELSKLMIRKELINEAVTELELEHADIDVVALGALYQEATHNVSDIQKSFEELVAYHNTMIIEKVKFIAQDLPKIEAALGVCEVVINSLLENEKTLAEKITKGNSFEELEKVIYELNEQHRQKGEFETVIAQLETVETEIATLSSEIEKIDKNLFSEEFESKLKGQLEKFNKLFSTISFKLYGERYALKYDIEEKNGRSVYVFNAFNANLSSGKKQGEIICFDLANILFSNSENLPTFNFLLNDKKELMHDNQLIKVARFVQENNVQLVASILKDKLPETVLADAHIVVELSQKSKLFKIEAR